MGRLDYFQIQAKCGNCEKYHTLDMILPHPWSIHIGTVYLDECPYCEHEFGMKNGRYYKKLRKKRM